jgi:mRNA interferase RelE/StbE
VAYRIAFAKEADRALAKLPCDVQQRIVKKVTALADNPRPSGTKALQGSDAAYLRIRVGDYRVVYSIDDAVLLVLVVRIGHRREVYR